MAASDPVEERADRLRRHMHHDGLMRFVYVANVSELPAGSVRQVDLEGRTVVLVNRDGNLYAIDDQCPHMGGPLGKGSIEGDNLVCPWHGWRWDPKTGRARWPSVDWRAPTYEVRLEGDRVMIGVP